MLPMSELGLLHLLDAVTDPMAMCNAQGTITCCNATFQAKLGGLYVSEIPAALGIDARSFDGAFKDALGGTPARCQFDVLPFAAMRTVLECQFTPVSVHREGGTASHADGVALRIRDVSEEQNQRYQTEQYALRLQNVLRRYDALTHAAHDAIWEWTASDDSLAWSMGISTSFGHRVGVVPLRWWKEHIHPQDADTVLESLQSWANSSNQEWSAQFRFLCANGSYRWVRSRGIKVDEQERQRYVGAMTDVDDLQQAVQRIAAQDQLLQEIAVVVAHQLRGPLTSLMGLLYLYDKGDRTNPMNVQVIDLLDVAAKNLDAVIHQVIQRTASATSNQQMEPPLGQER
jgi:PAS domain S-box-containing protein